MTQKKRLSLIILTCALGSAIYWAAYYNNFGWQISTLAVLAYYALIILCWKIYFRGQNT